MSNMKPTQFNFILPVAVVGAFPLFNTGFDVIKLTITGFLIPESLYFLIARHM